VSLLPLSCTLGWCLLSEGKAVADAIKDIEKQHGEGSIMKMGDRVGVPIPHIPTGIYSLDRYVLGCGGVPRGRVVEAYGSPSGGKSTLALTIVASAQRMGLRAAYIDMEMALDPNWCSKLGVDMDELFVSQPSYGEQALQIAQRLLESKSFGIIVVDSVAALVPKAELDGELTDSSMALQARLMSKSLRILNGPIATSNTVFLMVNQTRTNLGVTWGSPEVTAGGKALAFYSSVRLQVTRTSTIKKGDVPIGNKVKITASKNKVSPPFRFCELDLLFDEGFDRFGNLVDVAVERGVVKAAGSWYSLGDVKVQGRDAMRAALKADPKLLNVVETALEKV
jgi:recombination protein RecA